MLDPQRIGLNAASVGYLKRRHEEVDWTSFKRQLQTDDGGCVNVRRIAETPVNELHVMGGELKGLESNSNMLDRARQHRQMNAYPLRSFSADAPAIILPDKYGGLPMYTRNQVEIQEYVSRFTAPMSAPLQQDTQLLGRMGFTASNESASNPYRSVGFEMNMHKPKIAIDMNEAMIRQRKFLEASSKIGQGNKHNLMSAGVFISANGDPITEVEDAIDSSRDTINAFHLHNARQKTLIHRNQPLVSDGTTARVPGGGGGMAMVQRTRGGAAAAGGGGGLRASVPQIPATLIIATTPSPSAVKTRGPSFSSSRASSSRASGSVSSDSSSGSSSNSGTTIPALSPAGVSGLIYTGAGNQSSPTATPSAYQRVAAAAAASATSGFANAKAAVKAIHIKFSPSPKK
jgi:hypothetical protein